MSRHSGNSSKQVYQLISCSGLALWLALGLGSKAYSGWGEGWVHNYAGDIVYEIFWIWLVGAYRLSWPIRPIAIAVFVATSLIEFSQLLPIPAAWQAQLWWRLLLGTHFAWADFSYYALGCLIGGLSLGGVRSHLRRLGAANASNFSSQHRTKRDRA